jgi:hypothetical protein
MSVPNNLVVKQGNVFVVMAEIHNTSSGLNWQNYGNAVIYQALNEFLRRNKQLADLYFCAAYHMWKGTGIADLAVPFEGYATYKLALVLYASRVLNLNISSYIQIEASYGECRRPMGGSSPFPTSLGVPAHPRMPRQPPLPSSHKTINSSLKCDRSSGVFSSGGA